MRSLVHVLDPAFAFWALRGLTPTNVPMVRPLRHFDLLVAPLAHLRLQGTVLVMISILVFRGRERTIWAGHDRRALLLVFLSIFLRH